MMNWIDTWVHSMQFWNGLVRLRDLEKQWFHPC